MRHQHCSKKAPVSGAMQWLAWRTEAAAKTWVVESSHKLQVIVVSGKPGRRYCSNGCSAWDIGIVFGCLVLLCFVSFCFVVFCVFPILPIEVRRVLQQGDTYSQWMHRSWHELHVSEYIVNMHKLILSLSLSRYLTYWYLLYRFISAPDLSSTIWTIDDSQTLWSFSLCHPGGSAYGSRRVEAGTAYGSHAEGLRGKTRSKFPDAFAKEKWRLWFGDWLCSRLRISSPWQTPILYS